MKRIVVLMMIMVVTITAFAQNGATVKFKDVEHRRIVVTINGQRYQQPGHVVTVTNVPPGVNKVKIYRFRKGGYGLAKADLIYRGIIKVNDNFIYRCTIDDYESMTVQSFCCTNTQGMYQPNTQNPNQYDYDDHDYAWDNDNWGSNNWNNGNNGGWNGNNGNGNNSNGNNGGWNGNNGGWNGNNGNNNNGNNNNGNNGGWNGNNGNNGTWNNGNNAMAPQQFIAFKQTVQNNSFDSGKQDLVKTQLANNWISSQQLKELIQLFTFESSKLEIAKIGAVKVMDRNNLFTIYDAFDYESSKTEFAKYILTLK